MVSRYLIDFILMGGLIIGTSGVFFMSQGLLGNLGNIVLQGLVLAVPYAILFGLDLGYFLTTFSPFLAFNLPSIIVGRVIGAIAGIGIAYVMIAWNKEIRDRLDSLNELLDEDSKTSGGIFGTSSLRELMFDGWIPLTLVLISTVGGVAIGVFFYQLPVVPMIIYMVTMNVLLLSTIFTAWWATGLSNRQLQLIGLALTLLGIATQFVQPVLDLLNIKVM